MTAVGYWEGRNSMVIKKRINQVILKAFLLGSAFFCIIAEMSVGIAIVAFLQLRYAAISASVRAASQYTSRLAWGLSSWLTTLSCGETNQQ